MEQEEQGRSGGDQVLAALSLDERCRRIKALVDTCDPDDAGVVAAWLSRFGARLWCSDGAFDGAPVHYARMADYHARLEHLAQTKRALLAKQAAAEVAHERMRHVRDMGLAQAIVIAAQEQAAQAHQEVELARGAWEAAEERRRAWH